MCGYRLVCCFSFANSFKLALPQFAYTAVKNVIFKTTRLTSVKVCNLQQKFFASIASHSNCFPLNINIPFPTDLFFVIVKHKNDQNFALK